MALTHANVERIYRGPITLLYDEITFDNSYAAGGEALVPADVGLAIILAVWPAATAGWDVSYKKNNANSGTLQVFTAGTNATNSALAIPVEGSVARDFSTLAVSVIIAGR